MNEIFGGVRKISAEQLNDLKTMGNTVVDGEVKNVENNVIYLADEAEEVTEEKKLYRHMVAVEDDSTSYGIYLIIYSSKPEVFDITDIRSYFEQIYETPATFQEWVYDDSHGDGVVTVRDAGEKLKIFGIVKNISSEIVYMDMDLKWSNLLVSNDTVTEL